jgi:hypothetical protein
MNTNPESRLAHHSGHLYSHHWHRQRSGIALRSFTDHRADPSYPRKLGCEAYALDWDAAQPTAVGKFAVNLSVVPPEGVARLRPNTNQRARPRGDRQRVLARNRRHSARGVQ